jgi:exodeoxyribonuclease III
MKISTWNVNGIRASLKKGLREYLLSSDVDIFCLQETKAEQSQVDLSFLPGFHAVWSSAVKKGYSGTLILSRTPPLSHTIGLDIAEHDQEGRLITVEMPDFYLVNVYTPNSQSELARLDYRLRWDDAYRAHLKKLEKKKPVITCGDLNCAHQEIDLANPKSNRMNPGFSDEERASFTRHLDAGFLDVFRVFDQSPGCYTWWTQRTGDARAKNIGWRLDYFLASSGLRPALQQCIIRADVHGSDHCPVELALK